MGSGKAEILVESFQRVRWGQVKKVGVEVWVGVPCQRSRVSGSGKGGGCRPRRFLLAMIRNSDFALKTEEATEDLFSRGGEVTAPLKDCASSRRGCEPGVRQIQWERWSLSCRGL